MRFANLLTEDEIYDQMVDALMDLVVVYVSKNESNEETDKSADHVEKMAQRALGKAKSR